MADKKKVRKLANQSVGDILLRRHPSEHTAGCARRSTWVPASCDVFIIICWALAASLDLFFFKKDDPRQPRPWLTLRQIGGCAFGLGLSARGSIPRPRHGSSCVMGNPFFTATVRERGFPYRAARPLLRPVHPYRRLGGLCYEESP